MTEAEKAAQDYVDDLIRISPHLFGERSSEWTVGMLIDVIKRAHLAGQESVIDYARWWMTRNRDNDLMFDLERRLK